MNKSTKSEFKDLKTNLDKIKELSETAVPFFKTIKDRDLINSKDDVKATLKHIYKDEKFAIAVGEIQAEFIHKHHYHDEVEILCLLEGKVIVLFKDVEIDLELNKPLVIEPQTPHVVKYLEDTKILAITIPAGKGFPDA